MPDKDNGKQGNDGNADDGGTQSDSTGGRVFTQDELNAIVADRIGREQAKFGDYEDVKTQLATFEADQQKKADAEKSELDKAQAELDEAKTVAGDLQRQLDATRLQNAIEREAGKFKFIDPSDAFALVDRTKLEIKDGSVTGAENAIKALAEAKPHLVSKQQKPPDDSGASGEGGTNKDDPVYKERLRQRFGVSA